MLNIQELFLKTQDGVNIAINHHITGHDVVLIIAHGWFMTKDSSYFSDMANVFSENFDVISMDFRGHGKSSGFYTFTSKEPQDVKAVVNYAKKHYKKVYLIGFSLGGAIALIHSALEKDVDRLIAVSAPHSFIKIENQMWRKEAWSHSFRKFEFIRWITVRPRLIIGKKIRPIDIVDKIEVPTLFIAGKLDPTVHAWHTKSLYRVAKCEKSFELFKNCCHAEDLFFQERERFIDVCTQWLLKSKDLMPVFELHEKHLQETVHSFV
jgi:pimeloyl-ACP methyl ester carboxylesterase